MVKNRTKNAKKDIIRPKELPIKARRLPPRMKVTITIGTIIMKKVSIKALKFLILSKSSCSPHPSKFDS